MDTGADETPDPHSALDGPTGRLIALGQQRRYRRGMHLINEGERGDTLFVVLSGRVRSYSFDARDREITYGVYGPGETLGEMSLDGGPRSASIITLEPTVCSVVTRHTLRQHIAERPEFAFELISRVIRRARLATRSARGMALLGVYGRLVQRLDDLAEPQPDGTRAIVGKLTHADIASQIGCSREMVSKLMKDLTTGGHIATQRGLITIRRALPSGW